MKIRLKSVVGKGPIELKVLSGPGAKGKLIFNEEGIVEVPEQIGKILLGPGHEGEGYELVEESAKPDLMTQDSPGDRVNRKEKVVAKAAAPSEVKDFVQKM